MQTKWRHPNQIFPKCRTHTHTRTAIVFLRASFRVSGSPRAVAVGRRGSEIDRAVRQPASHPPARVEPRLEREARDRAASLRMVDWEKRFTTSDCTS